MIGYKNIRVVSISLIVVLVVSFLYVWQRIQIFRLGYKTRSAEKELIGVQEENAMLQFKVSRVLNPKNIKAEVERLGLDLRPPKEDQIVRIKKDISI